MTEFVPADFAALSDFPLLWRWTSPAHSPLPVEVLATIRPLTAARAAALAPGAAERCADRRVAELDLAITAEWDDPVPVRERLAALGVDGAESVVVSWNESTAAITSWATFVRYWDAFCYPSSDDVTVWAPGSDWSLCYRHFEFLEFGRSRGAT